MRDPLVNVRFLIGLACWLFFAGAVVFAVLHPTSFHPPGDYTRAAATGEPLPTDDELRAVVVKVSHDDGHGTGVIVGARDVLTNAHVVGDRATLTIKFFDGSEVIGAVLWRDPATDLALIVLPRAAPHKPAKLACTDALMAPPDGELRVVGNPLGLEWTVTRGLLAGLDNRYMKRPAYVVTALIERGNSGGPLFDRFGNVRGIVNALIGAPLLGNMPIPAGYASGFGLAIPLATVCAQQPIRAVL